VDIDQKAIITYGDTMQRSSIDGSNRTTNDSAEHIHNDEAAMVKSNSVSHCGGDSAAGLQPFGTSSVW
jgi:hypothetical protein